MDTKRKNILEKKNGKEQPKKPYHAPQLIVHGTLKEITKGRNPGHYDGSGSHSP
jgi:hypothetical protein